MPLPFLASFLVQLLIGVGSMVIGYLTMPKAATSQPDELRDMDEPTAESRPIPVLFGELDVAPNVLWWGDKATTSRKVSA
ncbi:hypothetical protein L905_19210 [Agrobacterium sp. TS43]|uniref:hypothetical protein n=1 Tax=Agrobacterium TaxID=357 RepID=UPI00049F65B2|nr:MULTISPECIES: hypothetical protein [Agrobacterium]KDR87723.1 hypothetical protein K538_07180 [Agrobacterium tumefaciens GW4]KVK49521.1 hypothetical protein L903_19570 [Agrobacterium sp. JL28]KVK49758.1 hypothetical protein L904_19560 [Agrobacterium sp. LY4]KVK62699.1 hypothetical protein L906_18685 [Agrobacterium sp. TS45]KVK65084.1 hypothetical protein L905_19210 [Agrobacterium sp. TS43]